MKDFIFGDYKAEIDSTDVEFIEKFESAQELYEEKVKTIPTDGKQSEKIRALCSIFFEFFDLIFGSGTSRLMFGDKISGAVCIDALAQLVEIMNSDNSIPDSAKAFMPNRASRRAKK